MTDQGFREGCRSRNVSPLPLHRKLGNNSCIFVMRYGDGMAEVPTSCIMARHRNLERHRGSGSLGQRMSNTSFESSTLAHVGLVDHRESNNLSTPCAIATRTYERAQVLSLVEV